MLYEDLNLLTYQELLQLPPPTWLMDGIIPEGGLIGLYGSPGSGKSFIALDWALSIASGVPWLGHPTTQRPVVYVAAEGGRGMQQRARAWADHHHVTDIPAIYFLLSPLYVREEGTVEAFLQHLNEVDPETGPQDIWPGLIIIDTLSRSFGGGEENASADMGHFINEMTRLAEERAMAALIVHHTNAEGKRERGHTAFRGAADAMFKCEATSDPATGHLQSIKLTNDKQKDAAEADAIWLRPVEASSSIILEHMEEPQRERHPQEPRPMRKVDMLTYLGGHPEGLPAQAWMLGCQVPRHTFYRRIKQLIADHEIYRQDGLYFAYPALADVEDD